MKTLTLIKTNECFYIKNLGIFSNREKKPLYKTSNSEYKFGGTSPYTIPHDVFNHTDYRCIGTLEDELKAVGGYYFMHVECVTLEERGMIQDDILKLFEFYRNNLNEIKIFNKKRLKNDLVKEMKYLIYDVRYDIQNTYNLTGIKNKKKINKYIKLAALLMYDGFLEASHKYHNQPSKVYHNYYGMVRLMIDLILQKDRFAEDEEVTIGYGKGKCKVLSHTLL